MALWHWTNPPRWFFVIDTDSYAGNFERELGGFVCGQFDEHGGHRGDHYRELYLKDHPDDPFQRLIGSVVDDPGDDGIHRSPVTLAPTPGWVNDGNGGHLKLDEASKTKIRKATLKRTYPAYQSVAIILTRRPTDDEVRTLVQRAKAFEKLPPIKQWDHRPKVTGCRLIEECTVLNETKLP